MITNIKTAINKRDRVIFFIATDFIDAAIGTGKIKIGYCGISIASTLLKKALDEYLKTGIPLPSESLSDRVVVDEFFEHYIGYIAQGLQKRKDFNFRYITIKNRKIKEIEFGIIYCKGNFKKQPSNLELQLNNMVQLSEMIGLRGIFKSRVAWQNIECSDLSELTFLPQLEKLIINCFTQYPGSEDEESIWI